MTIPADPWLRWDKPQAGRGVYQCARAALASREARLRREGAASSYIDLTEVDPVVASLRMMCGVGPTARAADELRSAERVGAMHVPEAGEHDPDAEADEARVLGDALERRVAEIVGADARLESPEAYRAARAAALREIRREESQEPKRTGRRTSRWAWRKLTTTERADVVDELRSGGRLGGTSLHLTHSAVRSLLTGEGAGSSMLTACGLYSARVLSEEAFVDVMSRDDGHACGLCRRALRKARRTAKSTPTPTKAATEYSPSTQEAYVDLVARATTLRGAHLRATMRAVLRDAEGEDLATISVHKLCSRPWWQAVELDGVDAMLEFLRDHDRDLDLTALEAGVRHGDKQSRRIVRGAYLQRVRSYWPTWGPTEVVPIANVRRWRIPREALSAGGGSPSVLESTQPTTGVGDDGVQRRELIVPIPPWLHVHDGAVYTRGPLDDPATWERPVRGSGARGAPQAPTSVVYQFAHADAATWSREGGFARTK